LGRALVVISPIENQPLALFTTLKAGGNADFFVQVRSSDELHEAASWAKDKGLNFFVLGWGSNILPADEGVPGLVIQNSATEIRVFPDGLVECESGAGFQELFLKTAQASLGGLEFAVGIPGTVGGALVSNAGAYRSNISEFLTEIEISQDGERKWVSADWMEFSYRDSLLRRPNPPQAAILTVRMRLPLAEPKAIYDEAREYQRQRIGKQPPPASAGSFFKNVYDKALADSLESLPPKMKEAGVVPAGYLLEACGLKGFQLGRCRFAPRHANFVINTEGASAREIRNLVDHAREIVSREYGVELEEEVLYLGRW
jgi:UDP-N-acetylmuramate dehydrogenase